MYHWRQKWYQAVCFPKLLWHQPQSHTCRTCYIIHPFGSKWHTELEEVSREDGRPGFSLAFLHWSRVCLGETSKYKSVWRTEARLWLAISCHSGNVCQSYDLISVLDGVSLTLIRWCSTVTISVTWASVEGSVNVAEKESFPGKPCLWFLGWS